MLYLMAYVLFCISFYKLIRTPCINYSSLSLSLPFIHGLYSAPSCLLLSKSVSSPLLMWFPSQSLLNGTLLLRKE